MIFVWSASNIYTGYFPSVVTKCCIKKEEIKKIAVNKVINYFVTQYFICIVFNSVKLRTRKTKALANSFKTIWLPL